MRATTPASVKLPKPPVWGCVYCGRSYKEHEGNKTGLVCECGNPCMKFETKYAFRSWREFYKKHKQT